jgi:hypothetical protein
MYLSLELKLTDTELIVFLLNDTNQGTVQLSAAGINLNDLQNSLNKLSIIKEQNVDKQSK